MAISFSVKALSRTRSWRKSTRAVGESPLVELALAIALYMVLLLRGKWRVGAAGLGSKI
jgi:hypothetical protein